jgi:methionyl-tRNA synthetase
VSGATPIRKESEHLFVRLADFEPMLREWLTDETVGPAVKNKLQDWFEAGLKDWDISRDAPYWGFEIPDAPGKYFYVWLDAPIGYQASYLQWCERNGRSFDEAWGPDSDIELYHFIGKDIVYFHTLFWPAMLHGAGFRRPTSVFVHGFLTVDGRKMSKSRGTFINARTYLDFLPPEMLRYYYASKLGPGVDDIDLALDDFVFRVNSELVNKVINIASRCAGILNKSYDSTLSDTLDDPAMYAEAIGARDELQKLFEGREYAKALRVVSGLADKANQYIDAAAPWALAKNPDTLERGRAVCTQGLNIYRVLMTYLSPVVPQIAEKSWEFLRDQPSWAGLDTPLLGTVIEKYKALMFRIDRKTVDKMVEAARPPGAKVEEAPKKKKKSKKKAEPTPPPAEISFDEFMRVEIRVGKVVAAEAVPKADKLLQLTVDIGGGVQRNIFAGIKAFYSAEEMVGRLVAVAANLAPRKMRFGVSEGMVLAAGDGRPYLISPDEGAEPGMRIR